MSNMAVLITTSIFIIVLHALMCNAQTAVATTSAPSCSGITCQTNAECVSGSCVCQTGFSLTDDVSCQDDPPVFDPGTCSSVSEETEAGRGNVQVTWNLPTATDSRGPTPTVTCNPSSGSTFSIGSHPVTCTAEAAPGNTATCTFDVKVKDFDECNAVPSRHDCVNAVCALTPDRGYSCTCNRGYNKTTGGGNTCTDVEPPVFADTCSDPLSRTADALSTSATVTWTKPTATDTTGETPTVTCNPSSGSDFMIGSPRTVTCTAVDLAFNSATCSFQVTVTDFNECSATDTNRHRCVNAVCENTDGGYQCNCDLGYTKLNVDDRTCVDRTPPVFTAVPCQTEITKIANPGNATATVTWSGPAATDSTNVAPVVECSPPSNSNFVIGDTQVTCTAKDGADNSVSCTFTVTVEDYDECSNNVDDCDMNAACSNTPGSFTCSCRPGFSGDGRTCTACVDGKYGENCASTCSCIQQATCRKTDGACTCTAPFTDAACDKDDIDAILSAEEPLLDTTAVDNATLICQVNLPSQDLDLPVVITSPSGIDSNAQMAGDGRYEFIITNLSVYDSGNYTCTATTTYGTTENKAIDVFEVDVITPGRIISLTPTATEKLGGSVTLDCIVFLRPTPEITWYNQYTQKISPSNSKYVIVERPNLGRFESSLTVTGLGRSDNGIYTCETSNNITDERDRRDATIIVTEVPEVAQVNAVALSSEKIEVTWQITYYGNLQVQCKVDYQENSLNWVIRTFKPAPPLFQRISNLQPFTLYTVRVICKNSDGESVSPHPQDTVKTRQGAPSAPQNVQTTSKTSRSITLQWDQPDEPRGTIAFYRVTVQLTGSDQLKTLQTLGNPAPTSLEVPRLLPFSSYNLFVTAFNKDNGQEVKGDDSSSITETTEEDKPSAPVNAAVNDEGDFCVVTWDPPEMENGIIRSYTIFREAYKFPEPDSGTAASPGKDDGKSSFVTHDNVTSLVYSVSKSELSFYAQYRFAVLATTLPGNSPKSIETNTTCNTPKSAQSVTIQTPLKVDSNNGEPGVTSSSFLMSVAPADTTDGPISCYDIVVILLDDEEKTDGRDPDVDYPVNSFVNYVDAQQMPGSPYIAISRNGNSLTSSETIKIGNTGSSSCTSSSRKRRDTRSSHVGSNGELKSGKRYTAFVRAYVLLDDGTEEYSSSPLLQPVATSSTVNGLVIAIGVILAILFAVVIVLLMLIYMKRRKQMPLLHSGENGMTLEAMKTEETEITHMVVPSIPLEDLAAKVKLKSENDDEIFKTEYKSIPESTGTVTKLASREECNKEKNRYINIVAYDETRVMLSPIEGEEGSDYVNACFVDAYEQPRKFIAAQGPRDDTVLDFWRMIWEQNCSTLIMLTKCVENGREKCAEYWPEEDAIMYGDIIVTLNDVVTCADYVIRKFTVQKSIEGEDEDDEPIISETRTMMQFHFLGWPDFGIPKYPHSMLCFIKRIRHMTGNRTEPGNIIVHCSAGVGRTGTYILIDTMLDMMKKEKRVDIYNVIYKLRSQRNLIVQSLVQYIFIHKALLEEYLYGHTEVDVGSLQGYYHKIIARKPESDLTGVETEYRTVASLPVEDTDQKTGNIEANKQKNRLRQVIPYDKNRVKLERLTGQEHSNYINASFIDGYEHKKAYIAAQGPLPNTMGDFWRLIWENQCSTVVMLTECEERGQNVCSKYWPNADETVNHAFLTVSLKDEKEKTDEYTIRDLEVSTTKGAGVKVIRQYHFHGWPEVGTPEGTASLVKIIGMAHDYQGDIGRFPMLVHCSAGSGRTGVFIAMSYLLQRAKAEGLVDVFQSVRALRQQRPHMVQDVEQYQFCYRAMMEYLDSFDHYANFK